MRVKGVEKREGGKRMCVMIRDGTEGGGDNDENDNQHRRKRAGTGGDKEKNRKRVQTRKSIGMVCVCVRRKMRGTGKKGPRELGGIQKPFIGLRGVVDANVGVETECIQGGNVAPNEPAPGGGEMEEPESDEG